MRVFNVYKTDKFWNAEDASLGRGIVRGPIKELVLDKAFERARREKCSKVVVLEEDGNALEEMVRTECFDDS
jgi:hypothetical protein